MNQFFDKIEDTLSKAPNIKEFKVFERSDNGFIMYSYTKMPALMNDRDMLVEMRKVRRSDGKDLIVLRSVDREDLAPRRPKVIRIEFFKASLVEEKGPDLTILEFQTMNLKGYFPARLINMMFSAQVSQGLGPMYKDITAFPKK